MCIHIRVHVQENMFLLFKVFEYGIDLNIELSEFILDYGPYST